MMTFSQFRADTVSVSFKCAIDSLHLLKNKTFIMKRLTQITIILLLSGVTVLAHARPLQAHITRSDNWIYSKNAPIQLEEWLKAARDSKHIYVNGVYTSLIHPVTQQQIPLIHERGQITVHMPDKYVVQVLSILAIDLNANVQDDYGEIYDIYLQVMDRKIERDEQICLQEGNCIPDEDA